MSNNLDDIQAIESLPDHIAEVIDILTAYLDDKPTVEMTKDLANKISYCAYLLDEEITPLVNELMDKEPQWFLDDY